MILFSKHTNSSDIDKTTGLTLTKNTDVIFLSPAQLVGGPVRGRCGTASVVTQLSMLLLGYHY